MSSVGSQTPRAISDQAYVLHSVPYKETSLIVELFTQQHGRLPVIAKGAKRKHSALRSVLVSFQPLDVRFSGRGEVKTLQAAEWQGGVLAPQGRALFAAYYLNEVLMQGLKRDDPHGTLFDLYAETLANLAGQDDLMQAVRRFELALLAELGYGLDFQIDRHGCPIDESRNYYWEIESGWVSADQTAPSPIVSGRLINQLALGEMDLAAAQALKGLTRQLLAAHVVPNELMSRVWMEQLIKND